MINAAGEIVAVLVYTQMVEFSRVTGVFTTKGENETHLFNPQGKHLVSAAETKFNNGLFVLEDKDGKLTLYSGLTETLYDDMAFDFISLCNTTVGPMFIVEKDGLYSVMYHPERNAKVKDGAADVPKGIVFQYRTIHLPRGITVDKNRFMVPHVELCDALQWEHPADTATITIPTNGRQLQFILGSSMVLVNGEKNLMDQYFSKEINGQVHIDLLTMGTLAGYFTELGVYYNSPETKTK